MKDLIKELFTSLMATLSLAIILCGIYPFVVWVLAQGLFPAKANGSLIVPNGRVVGSSLLSQGFSDPKYFHPRPTAAGQGYDSLNSGGNNLGPMSRKLVEAVRQRIIDYRIENHLDPSTLVPADAVTTSASGLDPHISLTNAFLQSPRVARARGVGEKTIDRQIELYVEGRDLGIFGEPRVNVLMLNLALDRMLK